MNPTLPPDQIMRTALAVVYLGLTVVTWYCALFLALPSALDVLRLLLSPSAIAGLVALLGGKALLQVLKRN